jgi:hypothetical protein
LRAADSERLSKEEICRMRVMMTAIGVAAVGFMIAGTTKEANAHFYDPGLRLAPIAQTVACRMVTERVWRNGRAVYQTRQVCSPGWGSPGWGAPAWGGPGWHAPAWQRPCRTVRQRVVRPNGTVVYRNVQRC